MVGQDAEVNLEFAVQKRASRKPVRQQQAPPSKTVSSERYNRQTCVQVHVSRHLRLRDAALLSVVTVNR
jgi:hypothetical protein